MKNEFLEWVNQQDNPSEELLSLKKPIEDFYGKNYIDVLEEKGILTGAALCDVKDDKRILHKSAPAILKALEASYSSNRVLQRALLPTLSAITGYPFLEKDSGLSSSYRLNTGINSCDGVLAECEQYKCVLWDYENIVFVVFCDHQKLSEFTELGLGERARSKLFNFLKDNEYLIAYTSADTVASELEVLRSIDDDQSADELNTEITYNYLIKSGEPHLIAIGKLLNETVNSGASDLHITPSLIDSEVNVSMRIQGRCEPVQASLNLDTETYYHIRDYLSALSKATSNGSTIFFPVDGETLTFVGSEKKVRLRPAFMPKGIMQDTRTNPVRIVLRVLDYEVKVKPLHSLGFTSDVLSHLNRAIDLRGKMMLMVGPVGTGKSTTLYSSLQKWVKDNSGKSAASLEDPIEQIVDGVDQVQITHKAREKGHGHSEYLKNFVRHDLDALCISEIRDVNTLEAANQYASVGSKIMSTLHATDEIGGLQRALSMMEKEDDKYMFLSNLGYIFSQRLVPILCPNCKEEMEMSETERNELKASVELWVKRGSGKSLEDLFPNFDQLKLFQQKSEGCNHCQFKGVTDRVPVLGVLEFSDQVVRLMSSEKVDRFIQLAEHRATSLQEQISTIVNRSDCDIRNLNI